MFRAMRRSKQQLTDNEVIAILEQGEVGVLAVLGDEGYPYTVPINYVYADGRILMHSAKSGHKIEAIRGCDKASFCVIGQADVVAQDYSTNFRSVVAFGRVRIVEDDAERQSALRLLGDKYNPGQDAALEAEIAKAGAHAAVIELAVEHATGKQSKELAQVRGPLD